MRQVTTRKELNSEDPEEMLQNVQKYIIIWKSGSVLYDTLMIFLKDVLKKVGYKKKTIADDKKTCKITHLYDMVHG